MSRQEPCLRGHSRFRTPLLDVGKHEGEAGTFIFGFIPRAGVKTLPIEKRVAARLLRRPAVRMRWGSVEIWP